MSGFLIANTLLFLIVTAYAVYLFVYLVKTRLAYIRLGQKEQFDQRFKERLHAIWVNVFGQKKLLKDKKSGIIHVMFFYGFILVQFGAIDFIIKGLAPRRNLHWPGLSRLHLFSGNCYVSHFNCCWVGILQTLYRKAREAETRFQSRTRSHFYRWINADRSAWERDESDLA